MTQQTLDEFKIGYAPEGWDLLVNHFRDRKMSVELAVKAGLVVPRKKGSGYYDRFRNRVVFPIFNWQNQAVGFGGRVMDDALPKYLNSPETPVYSKSRSLYGLDRARQKCRQTGTVYVVEGYFDLLSMHQFGIENTVATLGTALTAEHVQILKGFVGEAGKAILVYDSDLAGIKAAMRSVAVFQKGLLPARILVLPEGHDPDSFLMEQGPDVFFKTVEQAVGIFSFMVDAAVEKHGLSIDGKVRIVNDVKDALVSIDDPVGRSLRIKQLAERIGVEETIILQKLRQPTDGRAGVNRLSPRQAQKTDAAFSSGRGPTHRLETQMVSMMLQMPEMIEEIDKRKLISHFTDPVLKDIGNGIIEHFSMKKDEISNLISTWGDAEQKAVIARLSLSDENWDPAGCQRLITQFETFVNRQDTALLKRIAEAEKNGDSTLLTALLQEKQQQARRAKGNITYDQKS
jgi:DNA primase